MRSRSTIAISAALLVFGVAIVAGVGQGRCRSVGQGCAGAPEVSDAEHGCVTYRGCTKPTTVTFCEDTHFDPTWPKEWNHTVREEYRSLTWS